jgi:integrase
MASKTGIKQAVAVVPHRSVRKSDRALDPELADGVRDYMAAARAENTRKAYRQAWAQFEAWCSNAGRTALPADAATVAAWIFAMGKGINGRRLSRATINQYLAAVVLAHRMAGHVLDRKAPEISETLKGIPRSKAKQEVQRKAKPLMRDDLRELSQALAAAGRPTDVRDAALLVLGWAGALRRSELVGLDWLKQGGGAGWVAIEDRGIVITLPTSKGSQASSETIVIPCPDMPTACDALARWSLVASLRAGRPIFRPITNTGSILSARLTDHSVSRIIKLRVAQYYVAKGKSLAEAEALAAGFSGHSMRAGYATTAGELDEAGYRIQHRMRHKSMDTTSGYIRSGEQWTKSGLGKVGF